MVAPRAWGRLIEAQGERASKGRLPALVGGLLPCPNTWGAPEHSTQAEAFEFLNLVQFFGSKSGDFGALRDSKILI
jgi:hypothetical protein